MGNVTFERAVDMVAEAMRHARSLGLQDLLVNTTGLSGFPPPSIFARHALAVKWAESAGSGTARRAWWRAPNSSTRRRSAC